MEIKCKKTKRFLCEIDIEEYLKELRKLGISQEVPLRIKIPCRKCKEVEVYEIYENHYLFVKNIDKVTKLWYTLYIRSAMWTWKKSIARW